MLRVNDLSKKGELIVPPGYSAANALKSAWLMLQETVDREKEVIMKVKYVMIKSCSNGEWYKNKINNIYDVDAETKGGVYVKTGKKAAFVCEEDYEVME